MTKAQIAKNLLEEKNCDSCRYVEWAAERLCHHDQGMHSASRDFTCAKWEKPRPLNLTWSTVPTVNFPTSKTSEKKLIRAVTRELKKALRQ